MKKSFLALMAVFAASAQANSIQTIYKPTSSLPVDLQTKIYEYLLTQCPGYVIPYGLKETDTAFTAKDFDNGTVYYLYTTTFTSVYYLNGNPQTPVSADIVAKSSSSVKMDGSIHNSIGEVTIDGTECKRKEVYY